MRVIRYEIAADEAWTHTTPPLNRYWCFHGGVFGPEADCDRLETALRTRVKISGLRGEVKWSALTGNNIEIYKCLLDDFFQQIAQYTLTYRQIFLDRSYVHIPGSGEGARTALDTQYLICYQFLKHAFGLKYLPATDTDAIHQVTIRLDNHSSQKHTTALAEFVEKLGSDRLITKAQFVNSKNFLRLQICDLLMGAAGSYGNKMQARRDAGRRGMSSKQKCRFEMAKYIYNKLRSLVVSERQAGAFNWFESTGTDGEHENHLHHKIRIWKFIPTIHRIDKGWQNDHLDKQGRYQAPDIQPRLPSQPHDHDVP